MEGIIAVYKHRVFSPLTDAGRQTLPHIFFSNQPHRGKHLFSMAELVDYRQSGSDKETFTTQCGVDKYGNVLINLIRNDEEPMEAQVYLTLSLLRPKN